MSLKALNRLVEEVLTEGYTAPADFLTSSDADIVFKEDDIYKSENINRNNQRKVTFDVQNIPKMHMDESNNNGQNGHQMNNFPMKKYSSTYDPILNPSNPTNIANSSNENNANNDTKPSIKYKIHEI